MSDILKAVHKTAKGLQKSGAIDQMTMRKFDTLCLTTVHEFTAEQEKVNTEGQHIRVLSLGKNRS